MPMMMPRLVTESVTRLADIVMFFPPAMRSPSAHQGATMVLWSTNAVSIVVPVPFGL